MSDLLPCPFCGGPAVNVAFDYITCSATFPFDGEFDCPSKQIRCSPEDWNRRAIGSLDEAARAAYAVTARYVEPGLGLKLCSFDELSEREKQLHRDYAAAGPSADKLKASITTLLPEPAKELGDLESITITLYVGEIREVLKVARGGDGTSTASADVTNDR